MEKMNYYCEVTGPERLMFLAALVGLGVRPNWGGGALPADKLASELKGYPVLVVHRATAGGAIGGNYRLYDAQTHTPPAEIIAALMAPEIKVKLNETHTALVSPDKKTVTVGCQSFTREAVLQLAEALKET